MCLWAGGFSNGFEPHSGSQSTDDTLATAIQNLMS